MVNLKGYTLYRNDRKSRIGGGVALYVENCLKFTPFCTSPSDSMEGSIEFLMGKLSPPHQPDILVAAVYRPPPTPPSLKIRFP